jgi:hypothetical protein
MSSIFLVKIFKAENGCGGTSLISFSPNLFYSAGLLCPTYLMQDEKGGGS